MKYLFPLFFLLLLVSCESESDEQGATSVANDEYLPTATGQEFRATVVSETALPTDTFRAQLAEALIQLYPVLPREEPWFRFNFETLEGFGRLHFRTSNILFVTTRGSEGRMWERMQEYFTEEEMLEALNNPEDKALVTKNVWAEPQQVIFLPFEDQNNLFNWLAAHRQELHRLLDRIERQRLYTILFPEGSNTTITEELREHNFFLAVPEVYRLAVEESLQEEKDPEQDSLLRALGLEYFVWLRHETKSTSNSILIFQEPYRGKEQLSRQYIDSLQERVMKAFVPGPVEDSYMAIERMVERQGRPVLLADFETIETRGLWRMEGPAFMGGPYISYTIHDDENDRVITLLGFTFAPGTDKVPFMARLETILSTFRLPE